MISRGVRTSWARTWAIVLVALLLTMSAPVAALAADATPPDITSASITGDGYVDPWSIPLDDARTQNCRADITFVVAEPESALDMTRTSLTVDGVPWSVRTTEQFGEQSLTFTGPARMEPGLHVAKFVVTNTEGLSTERTYAFTVLCPDVYGSVIGTHWDPDGGLRVVFEFANAGTGLSYEVRMVVSASKGVEYQRTIPDAGPSWLNDVYPGASKTCEAEFSVPDGVKSMKLRASGYVLDAAWNQHPLQFRVGKRVRPELRTAIRIPKR